jgi:hypothetical protein
MSDTSLDEIDITGTDVHPVTDSVKLNGPPGTGKTTESAARVAQLIDEYDYEISDVLWATYRRSLALETLERLAGWDIIPDEELANPTEGATRYIATIHGIANRLLGGIGDIPTKWHRKRFCKKRNLQFEKSQPWDDPPGQLLFQVLNYAAKNLLDLHNPREREQVPMINDLRAEYPGDVANAWDQWQDWKAENEMYDFWEQLKRALDQECKHGRDIVVIDEYHDATPLMAALCEFWIEQAEIVIVAGDPLQVVNEYAGADPRFFKRLDLPEVLLDTTWRVPEEHWGVATDVLSTTHTPPPVERVSTGRFHEAESPRFDYVRGKGWDVPGASDARSPPWMVDEFSTDMMFLTRTQRQASGVARSLESAGVLYETQNSMDIDGWGARDGLAERTALYNALQRLADVQLSGFGLSRYSDDMKTPQDVTLLAEEAAALLDHTNHNYLIESRSKTTDVAEEMLADGGTVGGGKLREHVTDEFWDKYARCSGAVGHLNSTSNLDDGSDLSEHDTDALTTALKRNDEPVTSVDTKVYTIHASKGSEASNVVLYDGVTRTIQDSVEQDESSRKNEFRTWYVALTRASDDLFVLRDGFEWTYDFLPRTLLDSAQKANEAIADGGEK